MNNKTLRLIFFVVTFVIIGILVWCHRVFCRRNEKKSTTTPRLLIKKNWNRRRTRLISASPVHDLPSSREQSASYLPLISAYPSKPPPLGFKYPANMPQPDRSKTIGFTSHVDAYPSTSGAPYPPTLKNNRDSCPMATCCYSATQSTPYSIFNLMPLPSTSYSSERLTSETPDSIRPSAPTPHEPAHPLSDSSRISISPRTSYPPAINTNEDSDSIVTQHSPLTLYAVEHTSLEITDSTRNMPYLSVHEAPYQISNRSSSSQPTAEGLLECNAHYHKTTSNPPVKTISLSVAQRPPSYEEAMHNKF